MIKVVLGATIKVPIRTFKKLNLRAYKNLRGKFTRRNPDWISNDRMGFSNHDTPEYVKAFYVDGSHMHFPRGTKRKVLKHFKRHKVPIKLVDTTPELSEPNKYLVSGITLQEEQQKAQDTMLEYKEGIWLAYPSFGKTVLAIDTICKLGQTATIGVHSIDSQKQWIAEILKHTKIPKTYIGGVGGVFKKPKLGVINVCTEHSLSKPNYGKLFGSATLVLFLDEVQRLASTSFSQIPRYFNCPYRFGISASIDRGDGKKFMITDALGSVKYQARDTDSDSKIKSRIVLVKSKFRNDEYAWGGDRVSLINEMSRNSERNGLIIRRILKRVRQDKLVLVMVERRAHVAILAHYLKLEGIDAKIIMGKTTPKKLNKEIKKEFPRFIGRDVISVFRNYDMDKEFEITRELAYHKKTKVILTTQKGFIGMSIKTVDVGIIATPTGMSLELFNQKVGRVERSYGNDKYLLDRFGVKPTPIVEYIWDVRVPPLKKSGQNIIDNYPRKSSVI